MEYLEPFCGVTVVPIKIIDNEIHVLLYKRINSAEVFSDKYCFPNSFVHPQDDFNIEETAIKALKTKTDVSEFSAFEQLKTYSGKDIDPRGWTMATGYLCLNAEEGSGEYFKASEAMDMELSFNHSEILKDALERVKNKATYSHIGCYFLDDKFTLAELQKTYEILIGEKLDKSSFRKSLKTSQMVESLAGEFSKKQGRPAQLYKLSDGFRKNFFPKKIR